MSETLFSYVPFFLFLLFALGLAAGMVAMSTLLGRRRKNQPVVDLSVYECGIPVGDAGHKRLPMHFYLVAMLFILLDIEVAFLYPWAVTYRSLGWFSFWVMAVFLLLLTVGFIYVWKKGALDWQVRTAGPRPDRRP